MEAFDHSYTCRAIEEFGERRKAPTSDSLSRKRQLERTHKNVSKQSEELEASSTSNQIKARDKESGTCSNQSDHSYTVTSPKKISADLRTYDYGNDDSVADCVGSNNHWPISEANVTEANAQNEPVYLARSPIYTANVKGLWMTVWSMNVSVIAMIDMKGKKYWPEHLAYAFEFQTEHGFLSAQCDSEIAKDGYVVRMITLKMHDQSKIVAHYQFCRWSDDGRPNADSLMRMAADIAATSDSRMMFHCEEGTQFCDALVVIDHFIRILRTRDAASMVSVDGLISSLREQHREFLKEKAAKLICFEVLKNLVSATLEATALSAERNATAAVNSQQATSGSDDNGSSTERNATVDVNGEDLPSSGGGDGGDRSGAGRNATVEVNSAKVLSGGEGGAGTNATVDVSSGEQATSGSGIERNPTVDVSGANVPSGSGGGTGKNKTVKVRLINSEQTASVSSEGDNGGGQNVSVNSEQTTSVSGGNSSVGQNDSGYHNDVSHQVMPPSRTCCSWDFSASLQSLTSSVNERFQQIETLLSALERESSAQRRLISRVLGLNGSAGLPISACPPPPRHYGTVPINHEWNGLTGPPACSPTLLAWSPSFVASTPHQMNVLTPVHQAGVAGGGSWTPHLSTGFQPWMQPDAHPSRSSIRRR